MITFTRSILVAMVSYSSCMTTEPYLFTTPKQSIYCSHPLKNQRHNLLPTTHAGHNGSQTIMLQGFFFFFFFFFFSLLLDKVSSLGEKRKRKKEKGRWVGGSGVSKLVKLLWCPACSQFLPDEFSNSGVKMKRILKGWEHHSMLGSGASWQNYLVKVCLCVLFPVYGR